MTGLDRPPLRRRIRAELATYGRAPKLGQNVYKLGKGMYLAEILMRRGWRIVKKTKDYLYAAPQAGEGNDALTIDVDVPTQEQMLDLARRVHGDAPDRPWIERWGEWIARYYPRQSWSIQYEGPFTGVRGEMERRGPIDSHFEVGEHGLFSAGIDDVGGTNSYWESVSLVVPPDPALFSEPARSSNDNIPKPSGLVEGSALEIHLSRYERSSAARRAAIEHWGTACMACGLDFGVSYGELGKGYIQVHHLVPLAEVGKQYEIDPINDLRPVCPNCHAMIHRRDPPLAIDELRSLKAGETRPTTRTKET